MLLADGAFSCLLKLGTINGHEVGEDTFAGKLPMSPEEITLLFSDPHACERIGKAMASPRDYHYVLIFSSYGPT